MMNLSIIIGCEEMESYAVFDVAASWFPIHNTFFPPVISLKSL